MTMHGQIDSHAPSAIRTEVDMTMRSQPLRRASVLALGLLLSSVGFAFADSVPADGDSVLGGNQTLIDLGQRAAGEVVQHDVAFTLVCSGLSHPAVGATFTVQPSAYTIPLDGALSATSTTIGPVPAGWPAGGVGCPAPNPTLASNGPSDVSMTMPTTPGDDYIFTVMYAKVGATGLSGTTAISFQVDVVGNTPPTISVPASFSVEGTATGGADVTFTVGTSDAEDDPAPAATCTPASGTFFALGTTQVSCSVTDSGGLSASGSFEVTVVDTTGPALVGVPAGLSLTTGNPAGATLSYPLPTATDAVDSNPTISCSPAPGAVAPVGSSTVTCTATDANGNSSSASFPVSVTYVSTTAWSVVWGEPVGGTPAALVANQGRTVPVKVEIFADGVALGSGNAAIRVDRCGGGNALTAALVWGNGRWNVNLDTSPLGPGCYVVTATHDGHDAGSFRLDLRGAEAAKAQAKNTATARGKATVTVKISRK